MIVDNFFSMVMNFIIEGLRTVGKLSLCTVASLR